MKEKETAELLSIDAAAVLLGLRSRTLDQWRHRGQGPAFVKIGVTVRYRRSDVEAYLETCTVAPQRRAGG